MSSSFVTQAFLVYTADPPVAPVRSYMTPGGSTAVWSTLRNDTVQDRAIVLPLVSRLNKSERQATWDALCSDITRHAWNCDFMHSHILIICCHQIVKVRGEFMRLILHTLVGPHAPGAPFRFSLD